jgi:hypothetical protein
MYNNQVAGVSPWKCQHSKLLTALFRPVIQDLSFCPNHFLLSFERFLSKE